jgi:prephenate dehydratase
MTKIQSIPILGKPYQYGFHVDLEWDKPNLYKDAMNRLAQETINLNHFGEYPRAQRPGI